MKNSKQTQKGIATLLAIAVLSIASLAGAEEGGASVTLKTEAKPGKRPPFYINFMLQGSMLHEDSDNRLTSRDSNGMATPGFLLRTGGVVKEQHLIGALFNANWRSTQLVLDNEGGDDDWGAVSNYFLGAEYRYQTKFGLYTGAAVGFTYIFGDNKVGGGNDEPDCSTVGCYREHMERSDDQGVPGVGVRAVVGYEYRIKRHLALNVEAFVGVSHGENEHEKNMTTPTYGLAFGIGM